MSKNDACTGHTVPVRLLTLAALGTLFIALELSLTTRETVGEAALADARYCCS